MAQDTSGIQQLISKRGEDLDRTYEKTFSRWIEGVLQGDKEGGQVHVDNLYSSFNDGTLLVRLVEKLSGIPAPKYHKNVGKKSFLGLENIQTAMDMMAGDGAPKPDVTAREVQEGNKKAVLSTLWRLVHFYQLQRPFAEGGPLHDKIESKEGGGRLYDWLHMKTKDYPNTNIKDLHSSWFDGMGILALIHQFDPDVLVDHMGKPIKNFEDLDPTMKRENLNNAFNLAEQHLGVPRLLDVDDVLSNNSSHVPNEECFMTYLSMFPLKFIEKEDEEGKPVEEGEEASNIPTAPPPPPVSKLPKAFPGKTKQPREGADEAKSQQEALHDVRQKATGAKDTSGVVGEAKPKKGRPKKKHVKPKEGGERVPKKGVVGAKKEGVVGKKKPRSQSRKKKVAEEPIARGEETVVAGGALGGNGEPIGEAFVFEMSRLPTTLEYHQMKNREKSEKKKRKRLEKEVMERTDIIAPEDRLREGLALPETKEAERLRKQQEKGEIRPRDLQRLEEERQREEEERQRVQRQTAEIEEDIRRIQNESKQAEAECAAISREIQGLQRAGPLVEKPLPMEMQRISHLRDYLRELQDEIRAAEAESARLGEPRSPIVIQKQRLADDIHEALMAKKKAKDEKRKARQDVVLAERERRMAEEHRIVAAREKKRAEMDRLAAEEEKARMGEQLLSLSLRRLQAGKEGQRAGLPSNIPTTTGSSIPIPTTSTSTLSGAPFEGKGKEKVFSEKPWSREEAESRKAQGIRGPDERGSGVNI